jgi:hypothetical protein
MHQRTAVFKARDLGTISSSLNSYKFVYIFDSVWDSTDGKCPLDDKTKYTRWEIPGLFSVSYYSFLMEP